MDGLELDRWYSVDPESQDGKAFQEAMQPMLNRLFNSASKDKNVPRITFLLADDTSPYIRQETYDNQPTIIISKGLIAACQDEDILAAILSYQLLESGVLPERTPIARQQRRTPIDLTLQAIDTMRDAGYAEQGMMRALEMLNTSNSKHPLQAFDTMLGEDISDSVRNFGTRLEIAKRTRTQGWNETAISTSTMQDFEGKGEYRDFQMDVASAKRISRVENWLESKGYGDASLIQQAKYLQEALLTLPSMSEDPYMALWQDLSRYSYTIDQALLKEGEVEASTQLRKTFQQAAQDAGVHQLIYVTEQAIPPHYLYAMKNNGEKFQDDFGFLLPLPLLLDHYVHAKNNPLQELENIAPSLEAGVAEHALQWHPPENEPHPLKDFKEWLEDPEHKTHIRDRLRREKEILSIVREVATENSEQAAQMAHYAITSCSIMEPSIFKALAEHWKDGIISLIGTESSHTAGSENFHQEMQALTDDLTHTLGQQRATRLLSMLAKETEAQPDTAFMLEGQLQHKQQWDEKRFGYARGISECMAEVLMDQEDVRGLLMDMLLKQNPGSVLLDKMESIINDYVTAVDDTQRRDMQERFDTAVETMKQFIRLSKAVGAEELASDFDTALAGVERLHDTMRNLIDNPDKAKGMTRAGINEYFKVAIGETVDGDALKSVVNLGDRTFWDMAIEARGMVITALLFADGRTADSLMPEGMSPDDPSLTIRDFIKAKVIPQQLDGDVRLQIETFIDHYTKNTNEYDSMAILGYALALSKPIDTNHLETLSEGERQGQILTQVLSSFGPLGVKFAQAIEGMPHISNEIRAGMSSSKERPVDMPRWEYLHKVMDRLTPEVKAEISHYGPVLAAGSNQFTGVVTYKDEESALTCLHDSVRERAAFEAEMLQGAVRAVREKNSEMGKDTTSLRLAEGLLERAYDVMKIEHNYTIGKWQVQTAADMYNALEVKVGGMPIQFKMVDWKAHGDDFKIESLAHGVSFKKLQTNPEFAQDDLQKLAKGIQVVENMWLGSGQIFDSDRHGANVKVEPIRNKDGEMTGWQVNMFDVGALLTERPTRKARVALGKAMGEAITVSDRDGIPFGTAMQSILLEYAVHAKDQGEDEVANYLYEVPKAQLAQQDYNAVFSPEERQANGVQMMRTLLLSGRVDMSIAQGVLMTGGETLFHKAKEEIGSNVQKLLDRERRQASSSTEMQDNISIKGGRSVKVQGLPV
jgi:hypothetical protein